MMRYDSIPYMQIRGGSSKGIYFHKKDLPSDQAFRDDLILSLIGGDARQIDGLGGGNPLSSKVAVVSQSTKNDCDIDYLFAQVVVGENRIDTSPNCGNILAGVGIFAIENNMVKATHPTTQIKINMINSDSVCELVIQTPNARRQLVGKTKIDGVEYSAPSIVCNYLDVAGSICGALFPTGNKKDVIDGINVTCIDNGMPVVLIPAQALNKTGYESCQALSADKSFRKKIENIRLQAGYMMNLDDVKNKVIPKISLISPAQKGGALNTRTFIPHKCHSAIGVLGAVSVASACLYEECVTNNIGNIEKKLSQTIKVEHPSGVFEVSLHCIKVEDELIIKSAGLVRTARLISKGLAYPQKTILTQYQ